MFVNFVSVTNWKIEIVVVVVDLVTPKTTASFIIRSIRTEEICFKVEV
jgi:hypothetical protein